MNLNAPDVVEAKGDDILLQHGEDACSETAVTIQQRRSVHMGPIPSPEVLAEYNEIDPTFANRILVMAENQAKHRQELEKRIVKSGTRDSLLGIIFGFLIGVLALIVSLILGLNERTIESALLGVGGLGGLVSVFIYGTRSKSKENEESEEDD